MNLSRALLIDGWMFSMELAWLADHARCFGRIAEVGCFMGRSTRALADHLPHDGVLFAVDPWDEECYRGSGNPVVNHYAKDAYPRFLINLHDHIEAKRVVVRREWFRDFHEPVGMVFVDGCHEHESIRDDLRHALTLGPTLLCGHDYGPEWPGVKQAVDELFGSSIQLHGSIWSRIL